MSDARNAAPATTPTPEPLPADPVAYDSDRAAHARARGLSAPYIAGGRDPDPASTSRTERPYLILLVAMIAIIVVGGFVLGLVAVLLGG